MQTTLSYIYECPMMELEGKRLLKCSPGKTDTNRWPWELHKTVWKYLTGSGKRKQNCVSLIFLKIQAQLLKSIYLFKFRCLICRV
jgi:hypothetical protein